MTGCRRACPASTPAGTWPGRHSSLRCARHEGLVAADNILGKERHMDYTHIPQAIFLAHELAFCGTGGEGGASLALPGPGRGPTGRSRTGDTGLAKNPR